MKIAEMDLNSLETLKNQNIAAQKRGIHFLFAGLVIWSLILIIRAGDLPLQTKNMLTFCASAPMMPLALLFSRLLKIDFQNKGNPLSNLGLIFTLNQMLYLLIAMWVMFEAPQKMLMVYAMIFGAHLLPYSWLYKSQAYLIFSLLITASSMALGLMGNAKVLAAAMPVLVLLFCLCVCQENKKDGIVFAR